MSKDKLIVKQQLKIQRQKTELKQLKKSANEIHQLIYCIGGPLNDNRLQYTKEQMADWLRVATLAQR